MAFELQVLEDAGITLIDGDRGKNYPKQVDFMDSGHCLFLSAKNVTNTGFQFEDTTFISEERDNILRAGKLIRNDIVLTTRGTIGNVAFYGDSISFKHIRINSGMIIIRCDENLWNPRFLYFLFTSQVIRQQIEALTSGSAVPQLPARDLKKFKLPNIPKTMQNDIVEQVGALTDKIALNHQNNQTLEQMAQALFKSWFVDFDPVFDNALAAGGDIPEALQHKAEQRKQAKQLPDFKPLPDNIRALFPSDFEQTDEPTIGISGWIPKGWSISNIDECCSHIIDHRGKTPKKLGGDWSDSGFAAISAKNVKDGQIVRPDTIRFVDDDLYKKWMKEPLQPKDIIMTSEAPMGEMYFLAEKADYLLSQRLYGMRADIEMTTGEYLNYWLQTTTARADLEGRATGTTVTGIRQVELKKVIVLLPRLSIVNKFSKIVEGFLVRKEHNRNQNSNLEEIRDYLLPKLISGEIKLVKVD